MPQTLKVIVLAAMLAVGVETVPAHAAEREQVRMVIKLIAGVKMSFPQNLRNNLARNGTSPARHQHSDRGVPSSR